MKPNSQRAKNAIIGLYFATASAALVLLSEIYSIVVFSGSELVSSSSYELTLAITAIAAVVTMFAWIACAIVFIQWFRRAYFNLHKLIPSSKLRYSEGWAAGAWFIPIFNLFGPYQIATDMFTKSEKLLVENKLMDPKPRLHSIAGWWWGLWVTQNILGNISTRLEETIEFIIIGNFISIIGSLITIGAGYLAIQMIKNYSQMEDLLRQIPSENRGFEMPITNDDLLDSGI